MAKENLVTLLGQVISDVKVSVHNGDYKRSSAAIKVLRRYFINDNKTGTIYYDVPLIISLNPDIIKKMILLERGDMVYIKGVFTTKDVIKSSICPCGCTNEVKSTLSFVTPIYMTIFQKGLDVTAGEKFLNENSEISNSILIMGNLLNNVKAFTTSNGTTMANYKIASNRKFNLKNGCPEEYTDYPSVRSFHKQAIEDSKHLQKGSSILINGAIQTRQFNRNLTCKACNTTYYFDEQVAEIIPYSVEYLRNCIFEDDNNKNEFDILED